MTVLRQSSRLLPTSYEICMKYAIINNPKKNILMTTAVNAQPKHDESIRISYICISYLYLPTYIAMFIRVYISISIYLSLSISTYPSLSPVSSAYSASGTTLITTAVHA